MIPPIPSNKARITIQTELGWSLLPGSGFPAAVVPDGVALVSGVEPTDGVDGSLEDVVSVGLDGTVGWDVGMVGGVDSVGLVGLLGVVVSEGSVVSEGEVCGVGGVVGGLVGFWVGVVWFGFVAEGVVFDCAP